MNNRDSLVFSSASLNVFSEACNKFAQTLPAEMSKRFNIILLYCMEHYGEEGTYERLNNRSVSQIFAEYQAVALKDVLGPEDLKLVASGEVDGMRWELYDPPSSHTAEGECSDGQS